MSDENDLDLPDFDSDLPDDSWDDPAVEPGKMGDTSAISLASSKPKSFFQKNFNVIVIAIAAIGGGAFFYGKYLFPSPHPAQTAEAPITAIPTAPATPAKEAAANMTPPPMPGPPPTTGDSGTLTPPPPAPAQPNAPAGQAGDAASAGGASGTLTPVTEGAAPGTVAPAAEHPPAQPPAAQNDTATLLPMPVPSGLKAPPAKAAPVKPVELSAPPSPPAGNDNALSKTAALAPPAAVTPDSARVAELEKTLAQVKSDMQAKIDSLQASLDSVTKKLDAFNHAAAKLPVREARQETPPPAGAPSLLTPVPQPTTHMASAAPNREAVSDYATDSKAADYKPAPRVKTASSVKPLHKTMTWDLRSAQGGRAVVAPHGSDDLRQIGVGDRLPGLGRITFIGQENGVWVVRGSGGTITH